MPRKQNTIEELVSLVFTMGRVMRDKMHKKTDDGQCSSLLGLGVLRYVKESGQPHMHDIAKNFHVTPPAATLMIDSLVKGKLLTRVLDTNDRRSVRISLTPYGKRTLERGITKKVSELKKIFGVLTPAERVQFTAILKKIIKNNQQSL
jgi:DNA-binding MarR family transcriptional regulator